MMPIITSEEYKELVIKANKYDELQKPKLANGKTEKINEVEVRNVTPEQMGKILDDLKNKIVGGN